MTRNPVAMNGLPLVRWGQGSAASPERERAPSLPRPADLYRRPRARSAGISEIAAGLLLLVGWVLLWSYFLCAVVEPTGRLLRVNGEEHPSLGPQAAAQAPRPGPVSVDRDGGLP